MNTADDRVMSNKKQLDVRSKLSLLLLILIALFLFNHPFLHSSVFVLVVAAGVCNGLFIRKQLSGILPLLPILLLIFLFAGFNRPDHFLNSENKLILFRFGESLVLTVGGLKLGLTFLFRLVDMVTLTTLLLFTTDIDDFIQLFHKLRLPRTIAFILTTALRFIPELEKKRRLIIDAQIARGVDQENANFIKRYYRQISIMLPLVINAIVMADKLTIALLSRGFGYENHWTNLHEIRLTAKDAGIIVFSLIAAILCFLVRITTEWGRL